MKKFYTLPIAGLAALSGFALPVIHQINPSVTNGTQSTVVQLPEGAKTVDFKNDTKNPALMGAPVNTMAFDKSEFEGEWVFTLSDRILTNATGLSDLYYFNATFKEDNTVVFEDPTGEMFPMIAKYNPTTNAFEFNRIGLGKYTFSDGDHYVFMETLVGSDEVPFSLPYYEVRQGVNINGGQGLVWGVYDDEAGETQALGYAAGYRIYGANLTRPIDWQYYNIGQFLENIAYNFYFGVDNQKFVDVEIYRHPKFEHVYKVIDAFKCTYQDGREKGMSGIPDGPSPDMIIDASNPKNVLLERQPIGILTQIYYDGYYETTFTYYNYGWWWHYYANTDLSKGYDPSDCGVLTTDADGTVTIVIPAYSVAMVDEVAGDASFGSDYDSELIIPYAQQDGIQSIVANNDITSKVEYYNMQGVRLENPESGQLVIKKQGNNVSKLIVR